MAPTGRRAILIIAMLAGAVIGLACVGFYPQDYTRSASGSYIITHHLGLFSVPTSPTGALAMYAAIIIGCMYAAAKIARRFVR